MHAKLAAAGLAGALLFAGSAGIASAKDGDITIAGSCTAQSTSALKLKPRPGDGRLVLEFEVDQNVVGSPWRVIVTDNGTRIMNRIETTVAPSGSFTVRKARAGATGHAIVATARNTVTGETCTASGSV